MKNVLGISIIALVTACGAKTETSNLASDVLPRPSKIVFADDQRILDGALTEISLQRNASGKYDASKRVVIRNQQTGEMGETKEMLATGFLCEFSTKLVSCVVDKRPLDGALTELRIISRGGTKFDAIRRTVIVNRNDGTSNEQIQRLAEGLSIVAK